MPQRPSYAPQMISRSTSATTSGAAECKEACRVFSIVLCRALSGSSKEELLAVGAEIGGRAFDLSEWSVPLVLETATDVLLAALWSFGRSRDYRSAVTAALQWPDPSGSTASLCGALAGAFYGSLDIPENWCFPARFWSEPQGLADVLALHAEGLVKTHQVSMSDEELHALLSLFGHVQGTGVDLPPLLRGLQRRFLHDYGRDALYA